MEKEIEKMDLDFNSDPVGRLTKEVSFTDDEYKKVVGNFLLQQFKTDEVLKNAYFTRKVTLEEVWESITKVARKKAADNDYAVMSDEEVFGLAIHFVQDGKIKVKSVEIYTLTKDEKKSLEEQAKEEYLAEQKAKLEAEETKRIEKEKKAKEKALEKERKQAEESGQMSLFDFGD